MKIIFFLIEHWYSELNDSQEYVGISGWKQINDHEYAV